MELSSWAWNLFKLASYSKFGLDLDGNKLAKGMCLARKVRDRDSSTEGRQFFFFEFLNLSRR